MDENAKIILSNSVKMENWEDGEKATNDARVLREEFRRHLYSQQADKPICHDRARPIDK